MPSKQVVLITGSSTGFGRLFAETLARHGHTSSPPCAILPSQCRELHRTPRPRWKRTLDLEVLEMDVTDEASVDRAVHACVMQAGRIDVAINNAGYAIVGPRRSHHRRAGAADNGHQFLGCVRVNRAVLPFMRKQRGGLLLHVSSGAGRVVASRFRFLLRQQVCHGGARRVLSLRTCRAGN